MSTNLSDVGGGGGQVHGRIGTEDRAGKVSQVGRVVWSRGESNCVE